MNNNKWVKLEGVIRSTFTPQAPISKRELFVGRSDQISKMLDALLQQGSHAIVYGERGVGKTSLVTILQQLIDDEQIAGLIISKTQCNVNDTFSTICKKIFSNLAVTQSEIVINATQGKLNIPDTLDCWLSDNPTPDEIRRLILTLHGRHLIVIVDEFDSIANKDEITNLIANTIKTLSDTLSPSTFILVGIADTVEGLIAQHASIDRCLIEIPMPRMSLAEMKDLIGTGIKAAKMSMDNDAIDYICHIAQGLPSYVHLLCRESALIAIREHQVKITKSHAMNGLQNSLNLVPSHLLQDWEKATASTKPNNLFKQVLLACAFAPKNELGFFIAKDVRIPIREITKKDYEIPGYGASLHLLTESRRACILEKKGESHRWRYRFRNPLMEPYIIMYGLKNGLVTEEIVSKFR